jgi:hypothetical protein
MMRALLVVAALAATACASPPPAPYSGPMTWDCGETLETPVGRFQVWRWGLYWSDRTDDVYVQLRYRIDLEPSPGGEPRRFEGLDDKPELQVSFGERFDTWNWLEGRPDQHIFEARIGDQSIGEEESYSSINFSKAWDLFKHQGDLEVTLRDQKEAVLAQTTVSGERLTVIEQTLRELEARHAANLADKERRCRRVPDPPVFVSARHAN